jgi:hypothetical protein
MWRFVGLVWVCKWMPHTYVYVSQVVTILYCLFFAYAASQGIGKEIALKVRALNRALRWESWNFILCSVLIPNISMRNMEQRL